MFWKFNNFYPLVRTRRRHSVKKVFLKILQYSQENTRASLFLNKVEGLADVRVSGGKKWMNDPKVNFKYIKSWVGETTTFQPTKY